MANRVQWYQGQFPDDREMNQADNGLEAADRAVATDLGFFGIVVGGSVNQSIIPNMTVTLAGPTVAYDSLGQRVYIPGTQVIDCSVDSGGASTAVSVAGHKKILSIFAAFARLATDPRVDTQTPPQTVQFSQAESFVLQVYQGVEAASPTPPPLLPGAILIADIVINNTGGVAQTQIHTDGTIAGGSPAGHDVSSVGQPPANWPALAPLRAQLLFAISPPFPHVGWPGLYGVSLKSALTTVSSTLDNVNASGVINYAGSSVPVSGYTGPTGTWNDGSQLASETLIGYALNDAVRRLANQTATDPDSGDATNHGGGANLVGSAAFTTGSLTTAAGSVWAQIKSVANATGVWMAVGTSSWANSVIPSADTVHNYLDSIVNKLGLAASGGGTDLIGSQLYSGATLNLPSGMLSTAMAYIADHAAPTANPTFTGIVKLPTAPEIVAGSLPSPSGHVGFRTQQAPWVNASTGFASSNGEVSAAPGDVWWQAVDVPHGAKVTDVYVWVSAGGGASPGTPATLIFWQLDTTSGTYTSVLSTPTDPHNVSAHDVHIGASPIVTADRTMYAYYVSYTAEAGGTSAARTINPCRLVITFPTNWVQDIGAA